MALQLLPAPEVAVAPHHIFAQQKTDRKGNQERNEKRGNMRFHGVKAEIQVFFVQDIMKRKVVENKAENRIATAASQVIVALLVHEAPDQGIKEIQYLDDKIFGFSHALQK